MFRDEGVGVVIVDAFEVLRFNLPPGNARVVVGGGGNVAHEVFDEDGIGVGAFGDGFFVGAFEHTVEFATGGAFDERDHLGEGDGVAGAEAEGDESSLVVGTVFADGFRARAEGGDTDDDGRDEIGFFRIGGGGEAGGVVEESGRFGDGRLFREKEGEFEVEVGALAVEAADEGAEEVVDLFRVEHRAVGLQHFEEAAHVGAFELVGQVHGELHGGNGALGFALADGDAQGKTEIFDADAVDVNLAVVRLALRVEKSGGLIVRGLHGRAM